MSTLPYIRDRNLISARRYGIELDIEDSCTRLAADTLQMPALAGRVPGRDAELERQAGMFREILLHLWPEPDDPVVVDLRAAARLALHHVEILRSRAAFSHGTGALAG